MNPLVSIIVPHKNNTALIRTLFESIPRTSVFEVIVVDDNSSPLELNTLTDLCINFGFRIIAMEDSGYAGTARNAGINAAKGKWLIFADSDDYFLPTLLTSIRPFLERTDLDIVYFDVTSRSLTGEASYRHTQYSTLVKNHRNSTSSKLDIRYKYTPPWGKMINSNFIKSKKIYFDQIPASNDIFFSIKSGHLAREIAVSDSTIYSITQRTGSITSTISKANIISRFNAALKVNAYLRENNLRRYQHSILYFIYRSFKFDPILSLKMLIKSISTGNNPFIGIRKVLHVKTTIKHRESR